MEKEKHLNLIRKLAYEGKDYDEIKKIIQSLLPKSNDGSWSFDFTRIDDYIIEYELAKQEKSKSLNQIILGACLFILGLAITGFTFFAGHSKFILASGLILGGAWMFKNGYKSYQLPLERLESTTNSRIKKKKRRRFQ